MNAGFVTLLDDEYYLGGALSIYTLLKSTPNFDYPIIVLEWGNLSNNNKTNLKKLYPNIIFKQVITKDYIDIDFDCVNRHWNYNCGYRFDIFNIQGFDRIIYFDSDIIFQQNMNTFVNEKIEFGAVQRPLERGIQFTGKGYFNGGLLLIDKKFLNMDVRSDLIALLKTSAPRDSRDILITSQKWVGNEPVINKYFEKYVSFMDKKYNLCIDECDKESLAHLYNLHYLGMYKPWSHNKLDPYINKALTKINTKVCANILEKKLIKLANDKLNLMHRDFSSICYTLNPNFSSLQ